MLLDHMGILLFPGFAPLRWVGRIAMPLFAFFIGEGCRHTGNRKKYFLSVFLLGVFCQAVYVIDALVETGSVGVRSDAWYLNILLCFSVAIPGACLLFDAVSKPGGEKRRPAVLFALWLALVLALGVLLPVLRRTRGWALEFDYGVWAILLPLPAAAFGEKRPRLLAFGIALLLFCLALTPSFPIVWFSLLSLPLLFLYNGAPGSRKFKYAFYVFYPAHLGLLYLLSLLF